MDEPGPSVWTSMRGWFSPTALFLLLNLVIGTIAVTSRGFFSRRGGRERLSDLQAGDIPVENDSQPLSRGPSASIDLFRTFNIFRFRSGDDFSQGDYGVAPSHAAQSTHADAATQFHAPPLQRGPSSVLETLRSFGLQRLRSGVLSSDTDDQGEAQSPDSSSKDAAPPQHPSSQLSRGSSFILERLRSIGLRRLRSGDIPEDVDPNAEYETADSQQTGDVGDHPRYDRSQSDSGQVTAGKLAGKMKKSASASSAFAHFSTSEIVRSRGEAAEAGVPEEEVDARAEDFISRFKQQLKLQRLDSIMRYKEMLNLGKQN